MTEFPWPPDAVEQLRELRANGLTFGQIAKCMGRTRSAVIGKAKRLKLQRLATVNPPTLKSLAAAVQKSEPTESNPMPETKPPELNPTRLIDATLNQCRWTLDGYPEPTVCGAPGYPWCSAHKARVYPQQSRKELAA